MSDDNLNRLMHHLGYQFKQKTLLKTALTHRSVGGNHNERLEFIGDALLNCTIGIELFKRFPKAQEGELTRLRAQLVKGETVAELAKDLNIGEFLCLGLGELKSGGHQRVSILSDALEAIIGAIYLDSDMSTCSGKILNWYEKRLTTVAIEGGFQKDAKTKLQEWMQAKHLPLPEYKIIRMEGDAQDPIFTVQCMISVLPSPVEATGSSRRQAEQLVAETILSLLKVSHV